MKKYLAILSIAILVLSCDKKQDSNDTVGGTEESKNGYVISGKIENNTKGGKVVLNQLIGQNIVVKDSATMTDDGIFEFKGNVAIADFHQILFEDGSYMVLILDNNELGFTADKTNFEATKKITGSTDTDALVAMTNEVNKRNLTRQSLQARVMQAKQESNEELIASITVEFENSEKQSITQIKRVISANTHSFIAAIGAMNFLDPSNDFEFLDSISNVLNNTVPDSRYTRDLFTKVKSMRNVSIGSMAPEITLPNPDGAATSLSSLRGKYVLIDFWASWCRPCRAENPNVVRMYAKYKGPKFEIFGVSLDKDGGKWKDAIAKDGITWWQVSDLQGWNSVAAASYQVRSIPVTFLVDPEGKIIAKNLRGASLEEKMKEILG